MPDRLTKLPGASHLAQCADCHTDFAVPRPSPAEIDAYYPDSYPPFNAMVAADARTLKSLGANHGFQRRASDVVGIARTAGRILDIGCATGNFLHLMQQKGWQCTGVDIKPGAVQYARQHFGLDVIQADLESAHFPADHFDVVTMWDVLEHVIDPCGTIREVSRVLKPGGWFVLRVPNPQCWEAGLFGRYWAGWDAPRHLQLIPRHTLMGLLGKAGLATIKITSSTGRFALLSLSLGYVLDAHLPPGRVNNALQSVVQSMLARLVLQPYIALSDRLEQSSLMTVFARKTT